MDAIAKMPTYEAYKDSGGEWLGKIPESWQEFRLKYVFSEINERSSSGLEDLLSVSQYTGVRLKSENISDDDLLSTAETLEGYKLVEKDDLVSNIMLAWNGSLGFSNYKGIVSPAYSVYRLKRDGCSKYFHYLLRTEAYKAEYKRKSTGVIESRLRLYSDDFFDVIGICPSLEEQNLIANFLDQKTAQIDEAIAIKEQQIALLKERKQIIIQKAVTQGLNPHAMMKDSGVDWIGEIPAHWYVTKLKFFCEFGGGGTPSKENLGFWEDGSIPWVSPKDMKSDKIINTQDYITPLAVKNSATNYVCPNSLLLVVRSGILQRKIPVAINEVTVTLNQDMKALSLYKNVMSSEYLKYFIEGNNDSLLVEWTKEGATVESIEHEFLANGKIPIPPLGEQRKIVVYLENLEKSILYAIECQVNQIEKLKEYKTTLINSAVTGKIRITPDMVA